MITKLPYGHGTLAVDLRGFKIRPLQPCGRRRGADAAGVTAAALDQPLDAEPLVRVSEGKKSAAVVVPDSTRSCELSRVLPEVLLRLRKAGIPDHGVTVVVACGTHPAADAEGLRTLLGPLPRTTRVVQHDARDTARLAAAGRLDDGLEIRLNRVVLEAEVLVTIGAVRHHYFAGFGGGPKMVFPGVAGYEEIQANHSRVLDIDRRPPRRTAGCEPGVLDGNPVAEQIARAAALRPPDLALCLVPDIDCGIAEARAGSWEVAWAAAIERVRAVFEVEHDAFDLVVASGGGHPSDATLIQAHKGLDAACRFVRPGGEVLYVCALAGGVGSGDMAPFLVDPRPEKVLELLAAKWVQYGHTTLRIVEKTGRNRVHLVSGMAPELAERLGFAVAASPDEVVEQWRDAHEGATVGVLTGTAVYPRHA